VEALGSLNSVVRTDTQTHNVLFWQSTGGPAILWNDVASDLIEGRSIDMADSARLLAMMNLASADSAINCWNDKYFWDFWRPWNAIPSWTPLLSAPYPEHPSGHLALDTPAIRVLQMFFGNNVRPDEQSFRRRDAELHQLLGAARRDRPGPHLGGTAFRTADVQSVTLGDNIVNYMVENYFQPVGNH
jgi:hypothetical protein